MSENTRRAVAHTGSMLTGTDREETLFHTMTSLRHFVPIALLEEAEPLKNLWKEKSGEQISTYMDKAKERLLNAGSKENINHSENDGRQPKFCQRYDILNETLSNGTERLHGGEGGFQR